MTMTVEEHIEQAEKRIKLARDSDSMKYARLCQKDAELHIELAKLKANMPVELKVAPEPGDMPACATARRKPGGSVGHAIHVNVPPMQSAAIGSISHAVAEQAAQMGRR